MHPLKATGPKKKQHWDRKTSHILSIASVSIVCKVYLFYSHHLRVDAFRSEHNGLSRCSSNWQRQLNHFHPSLKLPDPAGFDINTRPWLTEALALGWIPGVSKVHSALLLPVDLLFSVATRWSISPLSLLTGQPEKLSPSNIFALWFPKKLIKKKKTQAFVLHLFRLMRTPVQAGCSRQLGNKGEGRHVTSLNMDLLFSFCLGLIWPQQQGVSV